MTCMLMAVDFGIKWNAFLQTGEFDFFSPLKLQIQSERSSNDWLILSLVRPGGLDVGSTTHCSARTGISTFNHQVQSLTPPGHSRNCYKVVSLFCMVNFKNLVKKKKQTYNPTYYLLKCIQWNNIIINNNDNDHHVNME